MPEDEEIMEIEPLSQSEIGIADEHPARRRGSRP